MLYSFTPFLSLKSFFSFWIISKYKRDDSLATTQLLPPPSLHDFFCLKNYFQQEFCSKQVWILESTFAGALAFCSLHFTDAFQYIAVSLIRSVSTDIFRPPPPTSPPTNHRSFTVKYTFHHYYSANMGLFRWWSILYSKLHIKNHSSAFCSIWILFKQTGCDYLFVRTISC